MKKMKAPEKVKKKKRWKWIFGIFIGIVVLGFYIVCTQFQIEKITIDGNTRYTDKEIKSMVIKKSYLDNSLIVYVMNRFHPVKDVPFINKITVTYVNPHTISIDVYEMAIAGCIEDMGKYIYFDRSGYVLESDEQRLEDIPCVEGLTFDRFVLHEKLPIKDKKKFDKILRVTQLIQENELKIDRIRFGIAGDLILYKDDIVIQLGSDEYLEEKMINLSGILEKAVGMKGTLNMEDFGVHSNVVTFIPEKSKKTTKKSNEHLDSSGKK